MNSNGDILLRLRGVQAQKGDWKDKYDPRNPNRINENDNDASCSDRPASPAPDKEGR